MRNGNTMFYLTGLAASNLLAGLLIDQEHLNKVITYKDFYFLLFIFFGCSGIYDWFFNRKRS